MMSPQSQAEDSVALSPEQHSPWGCKFVPETQHPETATPSYFTPRHAVADSESSSILKSPPSPMCTAATERPLYSRRVLLEEMLSAQMDLNSVPEDDFFLVPPQVFSRTTVSPLVIRPRVLRVGDFVEEEKPLDAMAPTAFRSIGESDDEDTMNEYQESQNALTQVRLKPRPTSFKDGQGAWDQMPKSNTIYGEPGNELLE